MATSESKSIPSDLSSHSSLDTSKTNCTKAQVCLVGTGPGDPELLTLRALRRIEAAQVALYDNLVAPAILDLLPPHCQRISVGKQRNRHTMAQMEINRLMIQYAQAGQRVVRLKGGDPFIFGRGGEEIDALTDAGISFEVVAGITAALGIAAHIAVPLTHRDYAQSVTFVAGHLKSGSLDLDWRALARPNQTIVMYMSLVTLKDICQLLITHGCAPDTPAAVIERGTLPEQKIIAATLIDLFERVTVANLKPPTLLIIGQVVQKLLPI